MSLENYLPVNCIDIINEYNNFPRHGEDKLVITDENRHKYITSINGENIISICVNKLVIKTIVYELEILGDINEFECTFNQLVKLTCHAKRIKCSKNRLKVLICPFAEYIICSLNELVNLTCPLAQNIDCSFNNLINLHCPAGIKINCSANKLVNLICPIAEHINYSFNDNLANLRSHCPIAKIVRISLIDDFV